MFVQIGETQSEESLSSTKRLENDDRISSLNAATKNCFLDMLRLDSML
jgi:hypothetical protein